MNTWIVYRAWLEIFGYDLTYFGITRQTLAERRKNHENGAGLVGMLYRGGIVLQWEVLHSGQTKKQALQKERELITPHIQRDTNLNLACPGLMKLSKSLKDSKRDRVLSIILKQNKTDEQGPSAEQLRLDNAFLGCTPNITRIRPRIDGLKELKALPGFRWQMLRADNDGNHIFLLHKMEGDELGVLVANIRPRCLVNEDDDGYNCTWQIGGVKHQQMDSIADGVDFLNGLTLRYEHYIPRKGEAMPTEKEIADGQPLTPKFIPYKSDRFKAAHGVPVLIVAGEKQVEELSPILQGEFIVTTAPEL